MEKEETSRPKSKGYPLRQYLNLGTGFDVHFRPNYYESDQEEEENKQKSVAEDEEEYSNLKIKVRQCPKRALSKEENKNDTEAKANSNSDIKKLNSKVGSVQDSVCITRTLTYTSKKEIIKLYQTERLNEDTSSNKTVRNQGNVDKFYPDKPSQLKDIVNQFTCGVISSNDEHIKGEWFKCKNVLLNYNNEKNCCEGKKSNKEVEDIPCREEKTNIHIMKSNEETYFFTQLGLMCRPQNTFDRGNNTVDVAKIRNQIEELKRKKCALYRFKSILENMLSLKESCEKSSSYCLIEEQLHNLEETRSKERCKEKLLVQDESQTELDETKGKGARLNILTEDMFPDDSDEDRELQDLIIALTESIDTDHSPLSCQEDKSESKRIENAKLPADDAQVDMTGMEHYKKRLIHQHEKPGALSSPCTTTEEDDDSLESPLSPASSVQSREGGQQDKKRDEVVQKVARKRAVCRSQFRHRSMELFKLGNSIPTSLCKTKEPYNVRVEKNLQMCFQNGSTKKGDKSLPKGSLTESILNTIDDGKRKDVPLWRSVSLNNDISERQSVFSHNNTDNSKSWNGRHILPAIVPELPERRKNRIKSLPENASKSLEDTEVKRSEKSNEAHSTSAYEFVEDATVQKIQQTEAVCEKVSKTQERNEIMVAHTQNVTVRKQSDALDCSPINLSLKNRDQPAWTDLFSVHHPKRTEVNNNQHLNHAIPKQPSNVPKKPVHDGQVPTDNPESKDGNCFFVTAIPGNALDPQKQSNVIVINFPHIQQQMSRMEKPKEPVVAAETVQSPLEMLDSAIMSLVDIVKSSVESAFNVLSLPVLNRLYVDLNRYLLLPTVSVKMKMCIEDALNALISYVLTNMFRAPRNPKTRDFVHKLLRLDLRPHMDFLVSSLDIIRQKIKHEHFTEHLLKVLSRSPPREDVTRPVFPNVPVQGRYVPPEFGDYRFWGYRQGMVPNAEFAGAVPQNQQQRKRRQHLEADKGALANARARESFNGPNLAAARPDLYLADNRCIPPNIPHFQSETSFMNPQPYQPRAPKGRPRNSNRVSRLPDQSLDLSVLPQTPGHRAMSRENQNGNVPGIGRMVHGNSDFSRRDIETNGHPRNVPPVPNSAIQNGRNVFRAENLQPTIANHGIKNTNAGNDNLGTFNGNITYPSLPPRINDNHVPVPSNEFRNYAGNGSKTFPGNLQVPSVGGNANETTRARHFGDFTKQCSAPDVEQFLQTNIIVNNNQNNIIRGPLPKNSMQPANLYGTGHPLEKPVNNVTTTVESENHRNEESQQLDVQTVRNGVPDVISSTVIIKDESMEISRDVGTRLENDGSSNTVNVTDLDDVVLERVSPSEDPRRDVLRSSDGSVTSGRTKQEDKTIGNRLDLVTDVSIEKVTEEFDGPPKLIKLTNLKRNIARDDRQQRKKMKKRPSPSETDDSEVVVIEDEEQVDYNQNKIGELPVAGTKNRAEPKEKYDPPIVEDISSDDEAEVLRPFRLYSAYENELPDDPRRILQSTEVSHCTLIEGNVDAVRDANRHLFEKPPVYTRPFVPQKKPMEDNPTREPLAKMVHFKRDSDTLTCSLKVKNTELNYPSTVDVRRFSPAAAPVVPKRVVPALDETVNWGNWFSEEQRKGVFDPERSRSAEAAPDEPLCEIEIDSKPYRMKRSLFERIPRGKLCYVRESNTFVRYFDDGQMELFISNLGEGSAAASDLLRQVRGPSGVGTPAGPRDPSAKGEVIKLSRDVAFSTEDFLSDPEQYVEEVEKVQRYVPKDFYGFYKFVTGYQIVNHHPPISFQTFLTMHNTNGIKGLFKNYVGTLAEGRNVL